MSLLLAAVTFNPALVAHPAGASGIIQADSFTPANTVCRPGAICGSKQTKLKGCYFNNLWEKGKVGATPLAIDVSETSTSITWVYWVNNLSTSLTVVGRPSANYYCPPIS